jgi:signal transduction histidine kinase
MPTTELKQYKTFYLAFREVSKLVHSKSDTDLNEVLKRIVSSTIKGLNAKGAVLCIRDKKSGTFEVKASYGVDEKYLALESLAKKRFFAWPHKKHHVQTTADLKTAPMVNHPQELHDIGIQMLMDVPLIFDDVVFGLIRAYFVDEKQFSNEELDFMAAVIEQLACAIQHKKKIQSHTQKYNRLATKIDRLASLGRMAAGVAHEINNPLTGILLYSSNLFKKAPQGSPFKDGLEIIMQETQRCKKIIQGLLDFSREKKPEKKDANVNRVIERALALMENEFLIKRIQIKKNLDSKVENFQMDDCQIEQVIINLLLNAAYAVNEEKGIIAISSSLDTENQRVIIRIKDNGHGIPQDKLKRIFEPFYTTKSEGSGLGLAVSYGIVKNHQGTIEIISQPGNGTEIFILLPILKGYY